MDAITAKIIKSLLSRLIFLAHSLAVILAYMRNNSDNPWSWLLLLPFILLLVESLVTVIHYKGRDGSFLFNFSRYHLWNIEINLSDGD